LQALFMSAAILGEMEEFAQEHKRRRAGQSAAQIPQWLPFLGKLIICSWAMRARREGSGVVVEPVLIDPDGAMRPRPCQSSGPSA
jgi:hypothetical protein